MRVGLKVGEHDLRGRTGDNFHVEALTGAQCNPHADT